jgi:ubiquinone/menaquinone biosynthesis C-methylase UbiE
MSETERIRHIYDERAATYDQSLGIVERFVTGPFRREFGALLRGETLEVAIGSGLNLPYYTAAVMRATGVDLSPKMLSVARGRANELGLPITLLEADAADLPFPDASFDTAAISLALCTIPDPAAALRELARVCRPDGRVVLLEHVRSTALPVATLQRILSPLNERAIGCHLDRQTFELAQSLGFTIDTTRTRLFDSVRLAVARPPQSNRATLATSGVDLEAGAHDRY